MEFHISRRLAVTLAMFGVSFILVMLLFIKKPDIVKSKNKIVRGIMVFAVAFVPGVMAASICAALITGLWNNYIVSNETEIVEEAEEEAEEDSEDAA